MRHALIRDGVVEQVILWDSVKSPKWKPAGPHAGCEAIACDETVQIGATYDGNAFKNPDPKPSGQGEPVGPDNLTDEERIQLKNLIAKSHGS